MRRAEREIRDFAEIIRLVERCDTLRIGLHDVRAPYIVPLSFGYEVEKGQLIFYVHGATEGKRHELAAADPRVCVEGDLCHGFLDNGHGGITCDYESFIGYGQMVLLEGQAALCGAARILAHAGYAGYPIAPGLLSHMTVHRIAVEEITGKHLNL